MDGGHKSVPVGLASYRSLKHHHNVHTMMESRSYMDPPHSALHGSAARMGKLLANHLRIFTIETTLNNEAFPSQLGFLNKRESEWSVKDQATMLATKRANDRSPARIRREFFRRISADYGVTSIQAGETEAVHERTLANVHRQQLVEVDGQADIMVVGLPYVGPYNVNSILNPILVQCMGLGYFFNLYRNKPVVRQGGVMILFHPTPWEFHQVHHPSYVDFFDEVLAETTDPAAIEAKFEQQYATDPWYIHLYRTSYAYHGVHPFYMWYWGAHAMDHLGDVIFVGADRKAVARMGFRTASTFADALEMAGETVGTSPRITYLHGAAAGPGGRSMSSLREDIRPDRGRLAVGPSITPAGLLCGVASRTPRARVPHGVGPNARRHQGPRGHPDVRAEAAGVDGDGSEGGGTRPSGRPGRAGDVRVEPLQPPGRAAGAVFAPQEVAAANGHRRRGRLLLRRVVAGHGNGARVQRHPHRTRRAAQGNRHGGADRQPAGGDTRVAAE